MTFTGLKLQGRFSLLVGFTKWFLLFSIFIRLFFFIGQFSEVSASFIDIIQTFTYGSFFDIGVLAFVWLLSTFYILLLPEKWIGKRLDRILTYFFFNLTLLIFVFTFFAEITFWDEFKCRFNFIAVDYLIYTFEVVENINESYPLIILIPTIVAICFGISFYFFRKHYFQKTFGNKIHFQERTFPFIVSLFIVLVFTFFIKNSDAEWSSNRYNNEISKAGIYSFFAELRNNKLDYSSFYTTISNENAFTTVRKDLGNKDSKFTRDKFSIQRQIGDSLNNSKTPNIVFVLMESMSADFMREFGNEKSITPFMDDLAQKGLLFQNLYATGTRTVRGMEAVTLSIPPTPGSSIVKRPDNAGLYTISNIFKDRNYQCNFFYGGDGYFDNMNAFFGGNGFDIYDRGRGSILQEDIKAKRFNINDSEVTFENAWGACDEDVYKKMIAVADIYYAKQKPFLNFIMTTSNHRPFTYPDKKVAIHSGTSRNGAVLYADFALQQLFEKAKSKPWFKNTIFVIIADHCASSAGKDEIDVANYHIPAIIYGNGIVSQKTNKLCSQIDIFPTLFGMLHWNYSSDFYGKDVLANDFEQRAFLGTYLKLGLMKDNKIMILYNQQKQNFYKWDKRSNNLKSIPMDEAFLNETISFYQSADYLFSNQKLSLN